jgi:hypothetical protein
MIHHRTVLATVVLVALAFFVASADDCFAISSLEKRIQTAREAEFASRRLDGSVLIITGDPDDISTHKNSSTTVDPDCELTGTRTRYWGGEVMPPTVGQGSLWRFMWTHLWTRVIGDF